MRDHIEYVRHIQSRSRRDGTVRNGGLNLDPVGRDLDPVDELNVALFAIGDVGRCIQSADTKSAMLGALLGLTIAGATSQLDLVRTTMLSGRSAAGFALAGFAVTLVVAGVLLGMSQVPRLAVPVDVRWLAFPALAQGVGPDRPGVAELRDEAWRQAEALARIAVHKFRYLRAGLLCSGLCVVMFLVWLALASVIPR